MKSIRELNGFIYLNGFDRDFWWCENTWNAQKGISVSYFLLNKVTRELFAKDIIKNYSKKDILITPETLDKLKTFKQNEPQEYPITQKVVPKGITLKEHQQTALNYMYKYSRYGFFLGPGTGKTLIAITWLLNANPKSALIVTPQKVIGQYKEELDKYIPGNNYVVTNYEQLSKHTGIQYDALILDESHKAKNYSSAINENCRIISKGCSNVYLFTGTPQDKARHEILSQLAILDERVMPVKTKTLERYFHINDYFKPKSEKENFKEELTEIILSYTWGKQTESVVNLTKSNKIIVKCPYPTTSYYDELSSTRVVTKGDMYCVADSSGVMRIALREICSGCITFKDNLGNKQREIFPSTKITKLKEIVSSVAKGIIYYEFTPSIDEIAGVLKELNKSFVIVNGSCSAKQSNKYINSFKQGDVDYLVIQSSSGNAGLDLTNVNTIIFYSLPESYLVYYQCCSRIQRIGQSKECNYYHLICTNTIEEKIYISLGKKKSFTDKVFKQYY